MIAKGLEGFSPVEEERIYAAIAALESAGYDTGLIQVLIRADIPAGYRGKTLKDGAALGAAAFSSQAMLNHVLEEELLHLQQKARGEAESFAPGTARGLEEQVDEHRRFPHPES
jgi:hypothetical protein